MTAASLDTMMRQMSGRLSTYLDSRDFDTGPNAHDEERAWIGADTLLADLHKQYLDAHSSHAKLMKQRGAKDPMVSVAADMADSARSAYETRMLEVREDSEKQALVKLLLRRAEEERVQELDEIKQKFWDRLNMFQLRMRAQAEKDAQRGDPTMALLAAYMMSRDTVRATRETMSQATAAFARASIGPGGSLSERFAGC